MDTSVAMGVPAPAATALLTMRDGALIPLRRHGNPDGPRLVLSHGNGLAINAYAPFWLPLRERFDLVLFDVRNHGESPLADPPHHDWPHIFDDFEEIFHGIGAHFGDKPAIGAFHSLSALAALEHASRHDARWTALVLFDPPTLPPDGHRLQPSELADMAERGRRARRRPESYPRVEDFTAQLARRPAFARWHPQAAALLARETLRPLPDGSWGLRCPRELEAHIFETKADPTLWPRLRRLGIPLMLIAGDPDCADASPAAETCRALHRELGIDHVAIPDTTHFLQIERPEACREAMIGFLRRHGLLAGGASRPAAPAGRDPPG